MARIIRLKPRAGNVTPPPPPGALNHATLRHTQFGATPSPSDRAFLYGGQQERYKVSMSGFDILTENPSGTASWYNLLWQCFATTDPPGALHTDWRWPAEAFADANGFSREDMFAHAANGAASANAKITGIDASGTVTLGQDAGAKQIQNTWFVPGMVIQIAGTGTAYDGSHTILSQVGTTKFTIDTSGPTAGAGTAFQLGDGSISLANRFVRFYFGNTFYVLNPWSVGGQAWCTYKHGQALIGPAGQALHEVFYDSFNVEQMPAIANLVESGGASFVTALASILSGFAVTYPNTRAIINTANFTSAGNQQLTEAAGGAHCEVLLNPVNRDPDNGIVYMQGLIAEGKVIEAICSHTFNNATPQAGVTGIPTAMVTAGGHLWPTPDARLMMLNYTTFLARLNDSDVNFPPTARFDPANQFWDTNIQAKWYPIFEFPIGRAKSAGVRVINGNLAADGGTVIVWQREYSTDGTNTDVLVIVNRCRFGDEPRVYDNRSLYTYTLPSPPAGKHWCFVNLDGSLSSPLGSTLDTWAAEGVILKAA